jgi:hypothetical protein
MTTAKQVHDSALDAAYDVIDQGNFMHAITAYALDDTYATVTGASLADVAMVPNTDYTKADGAGGAGSRKLTMAAKSGVNIDVTGTATQVAIVNSGTTTVLMVTTCSSQALTSGNTVNFPAWDHNFTVPT